MSEIDPFDDLTGRLTSGNPLHGAISEAEQWYAHNQADHYTSTEVMQRAWLALSDEEKRQSWEHLLDGYYHHRERCMEAKAMADLARADAESFLHHDDLEIIAYSLTEFDGVPLQDIGEDQTIGVPLDALTRLVAEVKYLRARLDLAGGVSADEAGGRP